MRRSVRNKDLQKIYHPVMAGLFSILYALFLCQFAINVQGFSRAHVFALRHTHFKSSLRSSLTDTDSPSDAIIDFRGDYPSGGQSEFAKALSFLSPFTPEHQVSQLEEMEQCFKHLDSELIRQECSETAENVIDELWRTIKLMYNGSSRMSAIAARQTRAAKRSPDRLRVYASVLKFLNPASAESKGCSLKDLKMAKAALEGFIEAGARTQVMGQLEKAIQGVEDGKTVQDSIAEAWEERERGARERLG
ncbi:hypothetical protein TrVE_jg7136 [Triparma verrucosa]|uniref:Uncharacterized protein n=1 Tax=Triparma verrucosa TaxID=1606542 RepID=A0A9W7B526_9STRA|nr:hypothetical protein TrVE_jg7136 [Triparma verrucosa]